MKQTTTPESNEFICDCCQATNPQTLPTDWVTIRFLRTHIFEMPDTINLCGTCKTTTAQDKLETIRNLVVV